MFHLGANFFLLINESANHFPLNLVIKNQKNFSKMIGLECQLKGIGKVKLLVGIKTKTGEMVQYCITALE